MKNFKYLGHKITITAGADISSGDPVVVGDLFGVACGDIANGESGEVQLTGVVGSIPKDTATAFAQGASVYWDVADGELNDDSVNNKLVGYAYEAALAADATMTVLLAYGPASHE